MTRFLIKFGLFLVPLGILAIPFALIFIQSRQGLTMAEVVAEQQHDPAALYVPESYLATELPYKRAAIRAVDPEIMVAGKSRTLQIRSDFFKDPHSFYNFGGFDTGGVSMNTDDLLNYIQNLPTQSHLKVIVFDLSSYLKDTVSENDQNPDLSYNPLSFFLREGWHDIYTDYREGRFSITDFMAARKTSGNIGITAITRNEGFRADGSYQVVAPERMKTIMDEVPGEISSYVADIEAGKSVFVDFGTSISNDRIQAISTFLAIAKAKRIYVIGYFSPYAEEIYKALESIQNPYGEMYRAMPAVLKSVFSEYGYHFYDMRDISTIGSSDKELYDAEHPTAKASMRMLISLADKEPVLRSYLDPNLQARIPAEPF